MKILLLTIGTVNYDHDINHYEPLLNMGYKIFRYNYLDEIKKKGERRVNKEIIKIANKIKPNYIFFITYQNQIYLKTLLKLKKQGQKVIGWFSDDHWRFKNYSKFIAPYLFCSITTDNKSYDKYKKLGYNAILSQWGANHNYYHPINSQEKYSVTFVGQKYKGRENLIEYLKKNNVPIITFGKGWNNYIPFEKMVTIFSNSKINLNLSSSSKKISIKQIKGRDFEIPMSGGFLLTEYTPEIIKYFEINKEIVCYENKKDLLEKINYYLIHEGKRKKIAKKGYLRSLRDHTWEKRFEKIFNKLKKIEESNKPKLITHTKNKTLMFYHFSLKKNNNFNRIKRLINYVFK